MSSAGPRLDRRESRSIFFIDVFAGALRALAKTSMKKILRLSLLSSLGPALLAFQRRSLRSRLASLGAENRFKEVLRTPFRGCYRESIARFNGYSVDGCHVHLRIDRLTSCQLLYMFCAACKIQGAYRPMSVTTATIHRL